MVYKLTFTTKQLQEWKQFIIRDFLKFEDFPKSNISGRFLVNYYWLEYLLNLFSQAYYGEFWEEIQNTKLSSNKTIESIGYGILRKI